MISQGSIGRAPGQADSEVLELPLLDHRANYFKLSLEILTLIQGLKDKSCSAMNVHMRISKSHTQSVIYAGTSAVAVVPGNRVVCCRTRTAAQFVTW